MNRSDLIDLLAARFEEIPPKDVELAVSLVLDALAHTLARGNRIEIRGFGSFTLTCRTPREARNPATGKVVQVPAKCLPHFKVGKELRERVDYQDERPTAHPVE